MKRTNIIWLLLAISLIGFLDASYLTIEHFRGVVPPCDLTLGCELVTTSSYSTIINIPVALLGAFYYLAMLGMLIYFLQKQHERTLRHIRYLSIAGFLASAYFVYLQVWVIQAICQWCMLSALTSTAIFIISWAALRSPRNTVVI